MLPLKWEQCILHKCIYSIDDHTQKQIVFHIRNGGGGNGQESRETERAGERERVLGGGGYSTSCKLDHLKIHMFDKQNGQHSWRLLLISKMRNLANDVSHNQSILTAKTFGAMTIRHFHTSIVWNILKMMQCMSRFHSPSRSEDEMLSNLLT